MKTIDELKVTPHLMIRNIDHDGLNGEVVFEKWKGSVICSWVGGWEHVSVAPYRRHITPSWDDMCRIKDMFWKKNECVVQYHPPKSQYVSNVSNCLHLWCPIDADLPMPPSIMVGARDKQTKESIDEEIRKLLQEVDHE